MVAIFFFTLLCTCPHCISWEVHPPPLPPKSLPCQPWASTAKRRVYVAIMFTRFTAKKNYTTRRFFRTRLTFFTTERTDGHPHSALHSAGVVCNAWSGSTLQTGITCNADPLHTTPGLLPAPLCDGAPPQVKLFSRALDEDEIKALRNSLGTLGATCLYYDESMGQWRPDGVAQLGVTDGGVRCVSDHLTEFSVVTPTTVSATSAKTADSDGTGNSGTHTVLTALLPDASAPIPRPLSHACLPTSTPPPLPCRCPGAEAAPVNRGATVPFLAGLCFRSPNFCFQDSPPETNNRQPPTATNRQPPTVE